MQIYGMAITNMKKMHQDTLTDHKKDMERMKAKIAQHSLKVDSFKVDPTTKIT